MFEDAADPLPAITRSERGSAFDYPRAMNERWHSLALRYEGPATKSGDDTMIVGDLSVFGGTGSYASVTGGGTLHGERTVALGGDVDYRFSLNLSGLPTERPGLGEK